VALADDESSGVLKGTTLKVYLFLLRKGEPVGVREVQRALNLSSPSIALYHLSKLEDAGLVKGERGNYYVNRVVLESHVKIGRLLIPRYFFYSTFAFIVLLIQLTLLRPPMITREYFFSLATTLLFLSFFCYETFRAMRRGRL